MPAILTHYAFAKETYPRKDSPYLDAVYLGAQGPDPFFFYSQIPWRKHNLSRDAVDQFGRGLHHIDITDMYATLCEVARESEHKDLLFGFIHGIFLHYCLDRNCHGYVFSKTELPEDKKTSAAHHSYLETIIDILIAKPRGLFTERPSKVIKIKKDRLLEISKLWGEANRRTGWWKEFDDMAFYHSVIDYQKTLNLTNQPHYFSHWLMGVVMGKNSIPYSMNYPRKLPKKYQDFDWLNEKHEPWPYPEGGKSHTESFLDLFEKAKEDYAKAAEILRKAEEGEDIRKELSAFVNNTQHDGISVGGQMHHFNPLPL